MTDPKNRAERLASAPGVDSERLAALLDGRLDERQRAEVVERLASSDDEFEAFVDALAVTRELEAEDAAAGVTPLRPPARRRWWQRPGGHWAAIAAVLVGLALLPALWNRSRGPGMDDPQGYAALLEEEGAGLPAGWDRNPWRTTRGAGDPLTPEARAVRLGAKLTDLEVAVPARNPRVRELTAEIRALLDGIPSGAVAGEVYRRVGERTGAPPEEIAPLLDAGWESVEGVVADEELFGLGAWAEAGRVAVARRDAGFFGSRKSRRTLERAAELPSLEEPARAAVRRIRAALRAEGAVDWASLDRELTVLLRESGS